MAHCDIIPLTAKACSGKCKSGACSNTPRVWLIAACEGMVSLFQKDKQGALLLTPQSAQGVFASLDEFKNSINEAEQLHAFDQLVVVGSNNDIAWVHAALAQSATRHIVAEIEYPLLPAWFKQQPPFSTLTHALESVFAG